MIVEVPNMSEQFYDYITEKLFDYFNEEDNIEPGNNFYVYFDTKNQVKSFYESIERYGKHNHKYSQFQYVDPRNEDDEIITLPYIKLNNTNLIFANDSNMSESFIVNLRNIPSHKFEIKNTSLLVICYKQFNSIDTGMQNLKSEGYPLSLNYISKSLENEIENSDLNSLDKKIIKFSLNNLKNEIYEDITLFNYKEILTIIKKGRIDSPDYSGLNLFEDSQLVHYTKNIENRLRDNNASFKEVLTAHQYTDVEEKLKKYGSIKSKLKNDNWKSLDWPEIHESKKEYSKSNDSLQYKPKKNNKFTEENLLYWEHVENKTSHIIIFNDKNQSEISIKFLFNKKISDKYLLNSCKEFASIKPSTQHIKVNFNISESEPTFKQVSYKHNNENRLHFKFNIVVINSSPEIFNSIKTCFKIFPSNQYKLIEIVPGENNENLMFGSKSNNTEPKIITEKNELFELEKDGTIKITDDSDEWEGKYLRFRLKFKNNLINFRIKGDSEPKSTSSLKLFKLKYENAKSLIFENNKAILEENSFYPEPKLKEALKIENNFIKSHALYGKINSGKFKHIDCNFDEDLEQSYKNIINYFIRRKLLPSFVFIDDELEDLYIKFLELFNEQIENIDAGEKTLYSYEKKRDLMKIGRIDKEDKIYYTSLSPINMAYQLELKNQMENEDLDLNLLKRLNYINLVPYIYSNNDEVYKPIYQESVWEWLSYGKGEDVSIGSTNAFISDLVSRKIKDFILNFDYLFNINHNAFITINIINISDDQEIVKGIFNFIKENLESNDIIPVKVNIYNDLNESSFDKFFECVYMEDINNNFDGFDVKSDIFDSTDVIRLVQNNIKYYKHDLNEDYEYAHISFYKVNYSKIHFGGAQMDKIDTGLSLNGLISSTSSFKDNGQYKIGFGTKNIYDKNNHSDNLLLRTVKNFNEIMRNSRENGNNPYNKNESIVSILNFDEIDMSKLYECSHWVTFIEPHFGIEYFKNDKNNESTDDMIIIHSNDQYTSSSKYDTITVTNKYENYKNTIIKFLARKNVKIKQEYFAPLINMFNVINGTWLLRMVSDKNQTHREKMSIISAIKYSLAILYNKNIIWIPISLEEILRIAGSAKLKRRDGVFYSKLAYDKYSDDLLFVGFDFREDNCPKIFYHLVEVKVGENKEDVYHKGLTQLKNSFKLIYDNLIVNDDDENMFTNKFFRNFIMQICLSNVNKLHLYNYLNDKDFEIFEKFKYHLLNDEYTVSQELEEYINKGSLMLFTTECSSPEFSSDTDFQIIELSEDFVYSSINKLIEDVCNEVQNEETGIKLENLISHKYM